MKPDIVCKRAIHGTLNIQARSRVFLVSETNITPEFDSVQTRPENMELRVNKLLQFYQGLNPQERALPLENIKRSLPASTATDKLRVVEASPAVFAAWLNSVVSNPSRCYPSSVYEMERSGSSAT